MQGLQLALSLRKYSSCAKSVEHAKGDSLWKRLMHMHACLPVLTWNTFYIPNTITTIEANVIVIATKDGQLGTKNAVIVE